MTELDYRRLITTRGHEHSVKTEDGKYLGWTHNKTIAKKMAREGRPNVTAFSPASDLSLYVLWDDIVSCGQAVVSLTDKIQATMVHSELFIVVTDDNPGWTVEMTGIDDFMAEHADPDGVIHGSITDEPFKLT